MHMLLYAMLQYAMLIHVKHDKEFYINYNRNEKREIGLKVGTQSRYKVLQKDISGSMKINIERD